jgi:hypothetical protein
MSMFLSQFYIFLVIFRWIESLERAKLWVHFYCLYTFRKFNPFSMRKQSFLVDSKLPPLVDFHVDFWKVWKLS